MNRRGVRVAALLYSLVAGVFLPAHALDLVPLTLDQLIQQSPRIVLARCSGSETREVERYGNNLFTFYQFDASEILHGDLKARFELRQFGGRKGDVVIGIDGNPEFVAGRNYLLFLGESNADGFPIVKLQGIFESITVSGDEAASTQLRSLIEPSARPLELAAVRQRVGELRRKADKVTAPGAGENLTPPSKPSATGRTVTDALYKLGEP